MSSLPIPNPLHFEMSRPVRWSRVNIAEAIPGVCTMLGFTFWLVPQEIGIRRGYVAVGAMDPADVAMPDAPDDFTLGAFHGRVAINISAQATALSRVVSYSVETLDTVMLGKGEGDSVGESAGPRLQPPTRVQRATAMVKTCWALWRIPAWQDGLRRDILPWWTHVTGAGKPGDAAAAIALLRNAHDMFLRVFSIHMTTGLLMGVVYGQLARLSAEVGHPGLETTLVTGYGGIDETQSLHLLWEVAHGRQDYGAFIAEHGFHGPTEGELSTPSWREDPDLLKGVIQEMSRRDDGESPAATERRQAERRVAAERTLIAGLPPRRRAAARLMIRLAKRCIPMRENSKACFLRAIDAARCAARVIGADMARQGVLAAPDDVYHLTYDEVVGGILATDRAALGALVIERRAQRESYLGLDLPFDWVGMPEPFPVDKDVGGRAHRVDGVGVSPGIVEGHVRIVTNPTGETRMEAGEILVCPVTDPSWASLLMLASGAVIDMGGALSHGAVVARELGIPCIMNTVNGSKILRTGDRVRIDGAAGTVEVLEAAEAGDAA